MLRIDPGLHTYLRRASAEVGMSLNDYCSRKLATPLGNPLPLHPASTLALERAAKLFDEHLIGIAAFGSWARGELADTSDIDLLVVVERGLSLTRSLYRKWDESPIRWRGRAVEPHFVHLPPLEETVSGIWAEVAIDGVVLFETGLRISTRLVRVRHDILSGRLVRRKAHGQPYWTEVA